MTFSLLGREKRLRAHDSPATSIVRIFDRSYPKFSPRSKIDTSYRWPAVAAPARNGLGLDYDQAFTP